MTFINGPPCLHQALQPELFWCIAVHYDPDLAAVKPLALANLALHLDTSLGSTASARSSLAGHLDATLGPIGAVARNAGLVSVCLCSNCLMILYYKHLIVSCSHQPAQGNLYYRTQMCRHYMRGSCWRGAECKLA